MVSGRRLLAAAIGLGLLPLIAPRTATPARAQTAGSVIVMAAGDISPEPSQNKTDDVATAALLIGGNPARVLPLGDTQYVDGTLAKFLDVRGYTASWGRPQLWAKSCPAVGNHEYLDPAPGAPGFFAFFRDRLQACAESGNPGQGYYAYNLGSWRVYVLNSDCQWDDPASPSCAVGSPQVTWFQADLQAHAATRCMLAYWHHPRWGSGFFADNALVAPLWNAFNHVHGDVVLVGHEHHYARFGPMTPTGGVSATGAGIRQLTVGTGGVSLLGFRTDPHSPGLRYRDPNHYGVVRMVLGDGNWASEFRRTDGVIADRAASGCWQ